MAGFTGAVSNIRFHRKLRDIELQTRKVTWGVPVDIERFNAWTLIGLASICGSSLSCKDFVQVPNVRCPALSERA